MQEFFKTLNTLSFPFKFSEDELVSLIDETAFNSFKKNKILELAQPAREMICPECGEHIIEVKIKNRKAYGICQKSDIGRFPIVADAIRVWQFNIEAFLNFLTKGLKITGDVKIVIKDKLWRVGKVRSAGNHYYIFYSKIDNIGYCKDFIEACKLPYTNIVILTNSPCNHLSIKTSQSLSIPILDILQTNKKSLKLDTKEFKNILSNGFKKISLGRNGNLIIDGKIIIDATPSTKEFYFLEILYSKLNQPVAYDEILSYCQNNCGKKFSDTAQTFCHKIKNAIKNKSTNKAIVDKIIKSTKTTTGLNAYVMINPQ